MKLFRYATFMATLARMSVCLEMFYTPVGFHKDKPHGVTDKHISSKTLTLFCLFWLSFPIFLEPMLELMFFFLLWRFKYAVS